jgi:hypothetical protein
MLSRAQFALLVSALLSIGAIATGLAVIVESGCETGGDCNDSAVAWVVGVPVIALGAALLVVAAVARRKAPGLFAQVSCTIWAAVLLLAAGAIGGAANVMGVLLAVLAVAMGALSVWVPR